MPKDFALLMETQQKPIMAALKAEKEVCVHVYVCM
jgi:hypothetical protein